MKYYRVIGLVLIILSISFIYSIFSKDKSYEVDSSNRLAIMLEQDDGSYKETDDYDLISEDYEFNENLSKCENGSEITWDKESKKIVVQATSSDKCYIYFSKKTSNSLNMQEEPRENLSE